MGARVSTLALINALTATASRNAKEDLLRDAYLSGERDFFVGSRLASDPRVSFGVKKVPLVEEDGSDEECSLPFSDFLKLCDRLQSRELTGHAAIHAMIAAAERASPAKWNNFYRRVLLKNLNVGANHKTINKVLETLAKNDESAVQYILPVFGCQLAQDSAKHPKKLKGKKLVDFKFDGVRLLSFVDVTNKRVTQLTGRNGTPNDNFPHLRAELEKLIPHLPASIVLDAEVVGRNFKEIMTQISRKDDVVSDFAKLAIFDIIPMADFEKGFCAMPQEKRHKALVDMVQSGLFQELGITSCYVLPKIEIDFDTEQGKARFQELKEQVWELRKTDETVEGLMIKDPKAGYTVGKKGTDWMKWKPYIEVTLKVVALEKGNEDKRFADLVGALVCEGEDDGVKIKTNVSSGISEEERKLWTEHPELILNWMVEVQADALTQDEHTAGTDVYSLRFPRLKGKRGTEPGEKM